VSAEERDSTGPVLPPAPVPASRIAPVQARSAARLETLLDAAATVVDEVGYERLTTAMVAERAGASIGTVYRYFPDRIALLHALSARLLSRYIAALTERLESDRTGSWQEALDAAIDLYADMYRTAAGFRAIRFGDGLNLGGDDDPAGTGRPAVILAAELAGYFPSLDRTALVFALEVVLGMIDALLHRAFSASIEGDQRFIDEARVVVREHLARAIAASA
jgi:AcrR family transcriptional regulator